MKTATEKYHAVLEGKLSEAEFIRQMRQAYPQYITQWNGYNDSVSILKQKQLIFEKKEAKKDIDVLADQFPLNVIERGIDAELEAKGIDSTGNVSKEDYMKARVKVIANLQKDANHYINLMAGESSKVDKHDQMVEPKKGNEVDVHNGLKKADLREGTPGYHDDGTAKSNDEMDDDERNTFYDNLDSVPEQTTKSLREQTIDVISLLKKERQADNDVIKDFIKTHFNDIRGASPSEIVDEFDEFVSVNYESPSDYMQETEKESRPHMSSDKFLRHIEKLHKDNQTQMAKEKEVEEAMSDAEMDAIKDYKPGSMDERPNTYKLGDKFSSDFDYEGMLQAGLKVKISTPLAKMQQLYDSFEDVNYHSENSHLGHAIDYIEDGDKAGALKHLKLFRDAIRKTLGSFNEGASKVRKQLNERVGSLQEFIALIQDRAEENGTSEAEEAEEVMYAIGDHYNIGVDIMKGPRDDDNGVNEGRRRKSQGGKVVTENDYDTGGYVESMGPIFDKAVNMLIKAWEEWKMGPLTEPGMIEFAKKDVLEYLETQLMVENLEEAKGKDHDGDGDVDKDDYMAAKDKAIKKAMGKDEAVKENIKAIIFKVLEEGVINEAATNALAEFSDTYGGYEGMKQAIIALQDIVTDIESYYDKTRSKIQKVYNTLGDIRNEEGLKVGGFLAPAIEQAFNKDLRPAVKGGFTKGLDQPKVRVISQADIDAHNSGERPLGEEEKQTVFSASTINGAL